MDDKKLFKEFPPVSTEQWKEKIIKDLKGADYDKKLVWRTGEGFDLQPFYREEDLKKLTHLDSFPGEFPFVRGKNINTNDWLVRQDIDVNDVKIANEKALDIRLKGIDSLGFNLGESKLNLELIESLLNNIRADVMELNFSTHYPLEMVRIIDQLAKKYNRDLDKIRGSVDYDPLDFYSRKGRFANSEEIDFRLITELMNVSSHLPNFHVLTIDGSLFHNAGSGIVSQLAFVLAKGADYLTYLTDNGFFIDDITPKIRFHFAVGSNYFMEIAKLRAFRYIWSKIVNAYGLCDADNAATFIHCTNSSWNKTMYDPYVNMLRTTTETMSAVVGGIDSMTVLPFDAVYESPTDFSERIARNQQLVIKGESYLDKVVDPAAGSYYIETLTRSLITESWKLFLEVNEMGGYLAAFRKGFISERIYKEASMKENNIATRKQFVLGTNQYPNAKESIPEIKVHLPGENPASTAGIETLKPYRGAINFEQMRQKTDHFSVSNKRPVAWMLTYGNPVMRKARAQFAANFFACAGFEIVDNAGFETISSAIAAAKKDKPSIVVICSSDEEYGQFALEVYEELKNEAILVLAGYPLEMVDKLKSAGMNNFIHLKSNVLEELKKYQNLLGIN